MKTTGFKIGDLVKVHGNVFSVLATHKKGKRLSVADAAGKTFFKSAKDCALVVA